MTYENSNYRVVIVMEPGGLLVGDPINAYSRWYEVINKETGITEHKTHQYPDALRMADGLDFTLTHKPWNIQFESDLEYIKAMAKPVPVEGPFN